MLYQWPRKEMKEGAMASNEGLQLRSLVKRSGELELSLASVPTPTPGPGEILVRVEATPINPSDIGLLFGAADMSQAKAVGTADAPVVRAPVPARGMQMMAPRHDESMPCGNEGAGTVIAAGEGAEGLLGKKVGILGGAMYAQYREVSALPALGRPEGASAADGASCFGYPLTALSLVEVMRREGHTALV